MYTDQPNKDRFNMRQIYNISLFSLIDHFETKSNHFKCTSANLIEIVHCVPSHLRICDF